MVGFLIGMIITVAEPDLQVLAANVPEIDKTVLILTVSVGVGIFLMLCMVRILFGISLRLLLIVFYVLVFLAAFLSDQGILAVAFDSGGVASGPMTAAFLLPLAQGACTAVGGNMVTDAFGVVAMVAMTPLITIQIMGLAAKLMQRRKTETAAPVAFADLDENAIIEL